MKSNFLKLTALLLLLVTLLTACGTPANVPNDNDSQSTEEPTTEADTSNDIYIEREEKEVKNILMIGNSFCYYYVEELCGIAKADGYELNVANLYKSGAALSEHYESHLKNTSIAELYVTTSQRRRKVGMPSFNETLEYAKEKLGGDWDVISLQGAGSAFDAKEDEEKCLPYAKELYEYIREKHPEATLYWHQIWSYEIGYGADNSKSWEMSTVEQRTSMFELKKQTSYTIAEATGVRLVPSGDAWEIARKNAVIGTTLCNRLAINDGEGDYYHDGDIGGGQYLNACVWYEVLMGESCVGNTWRPTYELSEEKIAILQAAAHEAVAAMYGPGYAK